MLVRCPLLLVVVRTVRITSVTVPIMPMRRAEWCHALKLRNSGTHLGSARHHVGFICRTLGKYREARYSRHVTPERVDSG
jgi:hypothetical protein